MTTRQAPVQVPVSGPRAEGCRWARVRTGVPCAGTWLPDMPRIEARVRESTGLRQRREERLDLLAEVLEVRREDERLAEMRRILVGRESRPFRCDLEQHARRLAE